MKKIKKASTLVLIFFLKKQYTYFTETPMNPSF
jgi:hypothetical protein